MDILCFANDWSGDPLSKQHIMRRLAGRGARVLWVNSLGNRSPRLGDRGDWQRAARKLTRFARSLMAGPQAVEERIWTLDPLAAPAYRSALAAGANALVVGAQVRAAMARLGFRRPVHYTFVPASAWVAGRLGERALVYHAADEYAAFAGADRSAIGRLEGALLEKSDLYVACSAPLYDEKRTAARRSILLRHGVDHAHFARTLDLAPPAVVADLPRPVVGFMGLVAEWVDLLLMTRVADALAAVGGSLVVIGGVRGAPEAALARLANRPNVRLLGRLPYADLPGVLAGLAVGLLPFVVDELTVHANPLKLREYLAAGLPVVATAIPEADALARDVNARVPGAVAVPRSSDDFVRTVVERAVAADAGPTRERSAAMACESWDAKVTVLEAELAAI